MKLDQWLTEEQHNHIDKLLDISETRLAQYLFEQQLEEGIIDWIKDIGRKLRSLIASLFSSATENLLPGEEVIVTITSSDLNEAGHVKSGALSSYKGNYNEVLVCDILNNSKRKGIIEIDKNRFSEKINKTKNLIKTYKDIFKTLPAETEKEILRASQDGSSEIALYIIGKAEENGSIIKASWVDNLGAIYNIEKKGDIKVVLEKAGAEIYKIYSLKLYKSRDINLSTSSPYTLVKNLLGNSVAEEFKKFMLENKELEYLLSICRQTDNIMNAIKRGRKSGVDVLAKYLQTTPDGIIDELVKKYGPYMTDDSITELKGYNYNDLEKIEQVFRDTRNKARSPINPILASMTYNVLDANYRNDFIRFIHNILKMIGFKDKETKLLIAIQTSPKSKVIIIDKHPELNLNNIIISYDQGKTDVKIMSKDMKLIMKFNINSGEKKTVGSKVTVSKNLDVDMSKYDDLRDILKYEFEED